MINKLGTILESYKHEPLSIRTNLARLLEYGRLGGTGKLVILPVDQGFEHGPWASFNSNTPAFNPTYHFELAYKAKLSAIALPLGMMYMCPNDLIPMPRILKLNHSNKYEASYNQAFAASPKDALDLGCIGIGITIYPGSDHQLSMFKEAAEAISEARSMGLISVVWAYPRGDSIPESHRSSIDVSCYAAHIAALLGAHIIKVKIPASSVFDKSFESHKTLSTSQAIEKIMQSSFTGKRLVLFSGGKLSDCATLLKNCESVNKGGGTGIIVGRNAFSRPEAEALKMLDAICSIFEKQEG